MCTTHPVQAKRARRRRRHETARQHRKYTSPCTGCDFMPRRVHTSIIMDAHAHTHKPKRTQKHKRKKSASASKRKNKRNHSTSTKIEKARTCSTTAALAWASEASSHTAVFVPPMPRRTHVASNRNETTEGVRAPSMGKVGEQVGEQERETEDAWNWWCRRRPHAMSLPTSITCDARVRWVRRGGLETTEIRWRRRVSELPPYRIWILARRRIFRGV